MKLNRNPIHTILTIPVEIFRVLYELLTSETTYMGEGRCYIRYINLVGVINIAFMTYFQTRIVVAFFPRCTKS